jgi:hypothetical protein
VATRDSYFGKDSEQRVAALTHHIGKKDLKSVKKGGKALVEYQALYAHLHWLIAGGTRKAPDHMSPFNTLGCCGEPIGLLQKAEPSRFDFRCPGRCGRVHHAL